MGTSLVHAQAEPGSEWLLSVATIEPWGRTHLLGGQFCEVVWMDLRDSVSLQPLLSMAAVVTTHHLNGFSSPQSLFLLLPSCLLAPPPKLTMCIHILVLGSNFEGNPSNTPSFLWCGWRGGWVWGNLQEEISWQGFILSQETVALPRSVQEVLEKSAPL